MLAYSIGLGRAFYFALAVLAVSVLSRSTLFPFTSRISLIGHCFASF